jgi:hypothetical protein
MSIQADAGERSDALMEWRCQHSEQIAQLFLLAAAIEGFGVVLAFTSSDGQAVSLRLVSSGVWS